jgi:hypothetical protein
LLTSVLIQIFERLRDLLSTAAVPGDEQPAAAAAAAAANDDDNCDDDDDATEEGTSASASVPSAGRWKTMLGELCSNLGGFGFFFSCNGRSSSNVIFGRTPETKAASPEHWIFRKLGNSSRCCGAKRSPQ